MCVWKNFLALGLSGSVCVLGFVLCFVVVFGFVFVFVCVVFDVVWSDFIGC